MASRECLICGAAFREPDHASCPECGAERAVASARVQSERRPAGYGPGDHAALLYESDARCLGVLLPYVRDGVAAGNRVVGVIEDRLRDKLRRRLTSAEARRLEVVSPVEQYGEVFSADRTYDAWSRLIDSTDGILRGFGGLDEPRARAADPVEWRRFEREADALVGDDALGLCLYDARYCSTELLATATSHPLIGARDKVHVCR